MTQKGLRIEIGKIVEDIIDNHTNKILTMKDISDACITAMPMYKELFKPRAIGYQVRLLGYQPFRKRKGYTIYK